MPAKTLINFSDAQLSKIGACKTQADFQAAVDLAIEQLGANKTEQKVVALEDVTGLFAKQIESLNASMETTTKLVATLDTAVRSVDPERLKTEAKNAGSIAAAEALGKVGASGVGVVTSAANDGTQTGNAVEALIKAGDYEGAWKASEDLQAEFSSHETFAAYKKAEKKGAFTIFQPKTK